MNTPDVPIGTTLQSDCRITTDPSTSQGLVPTSSSSSSSSLLSSSSFSSASSSSVGARESKLLTLPVLPPSTLAILTHPTKGRCLHTTVPLPRGTLVDKSPVLVFSKDENRKVENGLLGSYTFRWRSLGDDGKVVRKGEMALALGMGSLFNHSATPNVSYTLHPETLTIHYETARPVVAWEELCICYGDKLWFEDVNAAAQDRIAGGRGREEKIRMRKEEEHEDDGAEERVLQALMAVELGDTQEQEEGKQEEQQQQQEDEEIAVEILENGLGVNWKWKMLETGNVRGNAAIESLKVVQEAFLPSKDDNSASFGGRNEACMGSKRRNQFQSLGVLHYH